MPSAAEPSPPSPTTLITHPDIPLFPPASTFAFLPEVQHTLARLQKTQHATSHHPTTNGNGTSTSPLGAPPTTSPNIVLTSTTSNEHTQPLELKDLPAAVYPLKQKVQKAKEAVTGLADVQRGIEEQEREMRELQARCVALKGRLGELGMRADGGARE